MSDTFLLDTPSVCGTAFFESDQEKPYGGCLEYSRAHPRRVVNLQNVVDFAGAIRILKLELLVTTLTRQCDNLSHRIVELERTARPILVPINTFAPKPFEAVKQIVALVEPVVDEAGETCEYIASFVDGAISTTGDTIEEAVSLLKNRMAAQYTLLTKLPHDRLGKIPQQQLTALQSVMQRIP